MGFGFSGLTVMQLELELITIEGGNLWWCFFGKLSQSICSDNKTDLEQEADADSKTD